MANTIKVKTSDLTKTASLFDEKAGQIKSTGQKITGLVDQFNSTVWSGDAKNKYAGKLRSLNDDIDKMKRLVLDYVDALNSAASSYVSTEESNVSLANSLSEDVIR